MKKWQPSNIAVLQCLVIFSHAHVLIPTPVRLIPIPAFLLPHLIYVRSGEDSKM